MGETVSKMVRERVNGSEMGESVCENKMVAESVRNGWKERERDGEREVKEKWTERDVRDIVGRKQW